MDVITSDKKANTRQVLLDAARDLVFERGHERLSIQDITGRARVATGIYYNYFDCKSDIFLAVADAMREEIAETLEETRSRIQDPAMRIAVTLKFYFIQSMDNTDWRTFTQNADLGYLTLQQDPIQLLDDLERGVRGGRFKLDDIHFTQQLIDGMVAHVNQAIAAGKASRSSIDFAVRSVLQMLGLPEMVTKAVIQTAMPPMAAGKRREREPPSVVTALADYTPAQNA